MIKRGLRNQSKIVSFGLFEIVISVKLSTASIKYKINNKCSTKTKLKSYKLEREARKKHFTYLTIYPLNWLWQIAGVSEKGNKLASQC